MPDRTSPPLLYAILVAAVLLGAGVAGYVYSHEPARDDLTIQIEATPAPVRESIAGSVHSIDGSSLTLTTSDGSQVTLTLPAGIAVESLIRSSTPLTPGTRVNVGVENTAFGQVLTGVVAIDEATP